MEGFEWVEVVKYISPKVCMDKKEVKTALIAFALQKVDLGAPWVDDRDVTIEHCDESRAVITVRPNADLRKQNGEDQSA